MELALVVEAVVVAVAAARHLRLLEQLVAEEGGVGEELRRVRPFGRRLLPRLQRALEVAEPRRLAPAREGLLVAEGGRVAVLLHHEAQRVVVAIHLKQTQRGRGRGLREAQGREDAASGA